MKGIMANKPTGTIRGKSKVNEPWKPKKRSKKPMGQRDRNNGQQAHGYNKR